MSKAKAELVPEVEEVGESRRIVMAKVIIAARAASPKGQKSLKGRRVPEGEKKAVRSNCSLYRFEGPYV